jgi:hypothetical protein
MPKGVEFEQQCSYDASSLQGVTWQWDENSQDYGCHILFTKIYRAAYTQWLRRKDPRQMLRGRVACSGCGERLRQADQAQKGPAG